ncbi:cathepsin B-like [Daphnia pulicaria]|uniref:cathepsin B-like n=1 Tax=Daphnia pulicaria TaxID=35523 RepID=UPI001EEAB541|nr:cathepsin B-like [Daphnia pulicaria]
MKTCKIESRTCSFPVTVVVVLCLLLVLVMSDQSFDTVNTTSSWSTNEMLLYSPRSGKSIPGKKWTDKLLAPFRSLMGARAYDPWRYFMSVKRRQVNERRSLSSPSGFYSSSIPAEFDARLRWPNCPTIGEIFEQGSCASCWAVAPTDVMSDRICIHSGSRHIVRLSAGNLLSCCKLCGKGCKGGFPGGAWMHWKKHGIVTGGSYSSDYGCQKYQFFPCYQPRTKGSIKNKCPKTDNTLLECRETCRTSYNKSYKQDLYYGESVYRIANDVRAIQLEIMENGPVQANLRIYEDFLHYKSGVYRHVHGQGLEYHAVKIFGWGIEGGTPYWLAANPWSKRWGNGGFFKILRGSNHAEIEDHVMAGIPKLDPVDEEEHFNLI